MLADSPLLAAGDVAAAAAARTLPSPTLLLAPYSSISRFLNSNALLVGSWVALSATTRPNADAVRLRRSERDVLGWGAETKDQLNVAVKPLP